MENSSDEYHSIRLIFKHPNIKYEVISQESACAPDTFWNDDDQIVTPAGRILAGKHSGMVWSKTYQFIGRRDFFQCVAEILDEIQIDSDFMDKFIETGGSALLTVDIFGDKNFGDVLKSEGIDRLARSRFDFGVEIFPAGRELPSRI